MGYDVYCLSADTPSAQAKWQTKVCLLRSSFFISYVSFTFQKELPYHLLSDPNRILIGALTAEGTKTKRSHFVFNKGGMLVDKKIPVKPNDRSVSQNVAFAIDLHAIFSSPRLALEFIKGQILN